MELRILKSLIVPYHFESEEHRFRVDELEDGYWAVYCTHELFIQMNGGSSRIAKAESVHDALQGIRSANAALAEVMEKSYLDICSGEISSYLAWKRLRTSYFQLN